MFFVLLKGSSQYGALELHIDQLAAALAAAGHQAEVLDTSADDFAPRMLDAAARRPQAFLSLNGIGCGLELNGQPAYDLLDAVFASFYVDNPIYHLDRLTAPMRRKAAFFLDETHVELARAAQWSDGFRQIAFLPPGAIAGPSDQSARAFEDRDIAVLFTGTFRGEPERPWLDWPEGPTRTIVADVAERMAADAELPVQQALTQALTAFGAELTPQRLTGFLPVLQGPLRFAEAHHRAAFVRALGEAGASVTLYGQGWDKLAGRYASFDYRGPGGFAETLSLLPRTRIVLNTNNGFMAGGHERVFTAMSAGAHVFSDHSRYYAEAFEESREISLFRWRDLAQAPARLERLLADPDALAAKAAAGQARARREQSWASRVGPLLNALEGV